MTRPTFSPFAAFVHAVRSLWLNRIAAIHLTWPWMAIVLPFNYAQMAYVDPLLQRIGPEGATAEQASQISATTLPFVIVTLLSFGSIAVNWHRYILRDELAQGLQRLRLDRPVWRYLANLVILMLILAIVMLGPLVGAGVLSRLNPSLGKAAFYVATMLAVALSFRLSIKFPAIAIEDQTYSFGTALAQTKGMMLPIAVYAALIMLSSFVLAMLISMPIGLAETLSPETKFWVQFGFQFLASWIMLVFGITVLTSLYGFFVEGRNY